MLPSSLRAKPEVHIFSILKGKNESFLFEISFNLTLVASHSEVFGCEFRSQQPAVLLRLHAKTRWRFMHLVGSLMYLTVLLHAPLKLPTVSPDGKFCSRSFNVNANSHSTSLLRRRGKQTATYDRSPLCFFFFL